MSSSAILNSTEENYLGVKRMCEFRALEQNVQLFVKRSARTPAGNSKPAVNRQLGTSPPRSEVFILSLVFFFISLSSFISSLAFFSGLDLLFDDSMTRWLDDAMTRGLDD